MTGTISDPAIDRATIVVNGVAADFDVADGAFGYDLFLAPGPNAIQVVAENEAGVGVDAVRVHAIGRGTTSRSS